MQLDELLDHGQTDSHARLRTTGARISLTKNLEDMRQKRRVNSLPVVAHLQHDVVNVFFETNGDDAAARRKLDRVVQEIPDDLFEPDRVRLDEEDIVRRVNVDLD